MKIALITDQHFGVRGDHKVLLESQEIFYRDIFFPYLKDHNIDTIIDLGDAFDRRKYINFYTLNQAKNMFYNRIRDNNIKLYSIIGNHTVYYKNTNSVNTMSELFESESYLNIYWEKPKVITLDGLEILLCPWINSENFEESMKILSNTTAQILMGHLEIQGFEMYKGAINHEGFDQSIFSKFDIVMSGHFHHKSSYGNIHYLGAPYQMTWGDYNDVRGFHIFDTDSRELEFIKNPNELFVKLFYNDTNMTVEDLNKSNFNVYNKYIKVIVQEKQNPYLFDMYIDNLQKNNPADIKVVDDHQHLDLLDEEDLLDEAEDTITLMTKYIDNIETKKSKDKVNAYMKKLYEEALAI